MTPTIAPAQRMPLATKRPYHVPYDECARFDEEPMSSVDRDDHEPESDKVASGIRRVVVVKA